MLDWRSRVTKTFSIGYCHNGTVRNEFMHSVLATTQNPLTHDQCIRIIHASGPYIFVNRNLVVDQFLKNADAEWLLFVDNDIQFTPQDVCALLDRGNAAHQIVAGLYYTWIGSVFMPCWFESLEPPQVAKPNGGGLQPLASCGMGFTAIHYDALVAMPHGQWFAHDTVQTLVGPYLCGEDATFCLRATKSGIQTWGVSDVAVNHYKVSAENRETAMMRGL